MNVYIIIDMVCCLSRIMILHPLKQVYGDHEFKMPLTLRT